MLQLNKVIMEDLNQIISDNIDWERLSNKTVFISGANGMISSYLIYTLLLLNDVRNYNIHIIGMVRNEENAIRRFGDLVNRNDFDLFIQDAAVPVHTDIQSDYIIHAASQTSPRAFLNDPVGTIRTNVYETFNLLEYTRHCKAHFLYLSTREIYGENSIPVNQYVAEKDYGAVDTTLIRSCYPESKRMAENTAIAYQHQYKINVKIVRIDHTYGPGMATGDGRVVGDFIGDYLHQRDILLKSTGQVILALTYLSDIVSGIFRVMLQSKHTVYNLSKNDEPISVLNLAKLISSLNGANSKIVFDESHINSDKKETGYLQNKVALLDSSRARSLGWIPHITLDEGLLRLIRYESMK